jgi:predicted XRE-type DNA-binding protein
MGSAENELLDVLEQIKRLMILSLSRDGASQSEIAKALGVNQSSISRLFSNKPVKVVRKQRTG